MNDEPRFLHRNPAMPPTSNPGAAAWHEPELADQGDVDRINAGLARARRAETADELARQLTYVESQARHLRKRLRRLGRPC